MVLLEESVIRVHICLVRVDMTSMVSGGVCKCVRSAELVRGGEGDCVRSAERSECCKVCSCVVFSSTGLHSRHWHGCQGHGEGAGDEDGYLTCHF